MARFGNGPVGIQLLSLPMLPAKSRPVSASACDRAKQNSLALRVNSQPVDGRTWPNSYQYLLITMKRIRALKDIPIQTLIPLLVSSSRMSLDYSTCTATSGSGARISTSNTD